MQYLRTIDFSETLKRKSIFLFGARQTGKSTLLKERYPEAFYIDLLKRSTVQSYEKDLKLFLENVEYVIKNQNKKLIIIDEIQKYPTLLDEVHFLIEKYKDVRFILTGSSARVLCVCRRGVTILTPFV